jgi:O-antigen/teichoic acid export membrane protein
LLIPLHKDKVILIGSVIATVIALTLNYFFVKKYGAVGSSIILVVSVLCANVYPFYYAIKNKLLIFPIRKLFINLMYSIPYIIICVAIKLLFENSIMVLLFAGLISLIYFTICQWFYLKNEFVIGVLKSFTLHLHLNYRK